MTTRLRRLSLVAAVLTCLSGAVPAAGQPTPPPSAPPTDLDVLMEKVLERRNENWRALHDYVLDERETLRLLGPGDVPLHQLRREFTWYARDGYLIRSPVTANGVALGEQERASYEGRWLESEKRREQRQKDRDSKKTGSPPPLAAPPEPQDPDIELGEMFARGAEPRFISEAYFLKFPFERGSYYLAGRETLDGRHVLRIEYYPTRLFGDRSDHASSDRAKPRSPREDEDLEDQIERSMNKVSLVTLWVDPEEHQIVRFTFDNVGLNFLPGRAFARVDEGRASMTMGRYFGNVWLPRTIEFDVAVSLAAGTYRADYTREFSDYRKAETSVRVRAYAPREP